MTDGDREDKELEVEHHCPGNEEEDEKEEVCIMLEENKSMNAKASYQKLQTELGLEMTRSKMEKVSVH
jgi:hypothetical protein